MVNPSRFFLRLLLPALFGPALCLAQLDRSTLTGTVTDPQGARVDGAEVRVIRKATGLERRAITSSQGNYVVDGLPVGVYSVAVRKAGFSDLLIEDVEQDVGQTHRLDARLELNRVSQQTTVSAPLVQVETASPAIGAPIEEKQLEELPLNGRNWSHLTSLAPGATDTGSSDQRSIRFSGHGLDDNNFTFDGIDASGILNQAQKQYVRLAIPLESIAEFRVQSQNFDADIGMTAGGQISVASASGTNSLHGSAFDYLRNDVFDARSPFDGSSPAPFVLNQFGGSIGGAIVANKTFFFTNYEGLRQRLGQTRIGLVPSPSFIAQASANNPSLLPILAAYPAGTSPTAKATTYNYIAEPNQIDNEDSGTLRIDQHFSDKTTAFLRFSADEADYTIPTGVLNALQNTDTKLKNGVVELLHVFSPSIVTEAKFGVNQDQYHVATLTPLNYSVRVSGFSALNANSTSDGQGTTFSYIDDTTWVTGKHTVKFGIEIRRINMNQGNSSSGTLTYNSASNFLNDALDGATYASQLPLARLRKTQTYAYVQNEYRITSNLTLNLGLRYNFFNVFHEANDRALPFDLETCGGYCSPTADFTHPRTNDIDPRVGIAWAHGNTVVRAGGGIYHTDGQEDDQNLPIANVIQRYTLTGSQIAGLSFPIAPFLSVAQGIVTPRDMYRNRKDAYVTAWTASIQRTLPGNLVASGSYVGNKGTDLLTTTYQNTVNPLTGTRPYPQFGTIEFRKDDSNSSFEAMQLGLRRAFQRGLLLSANYMWSHSINDDGIGGGESDVPQNVLCRACEKASSDFDERQVFNASAVYELPFGGGKRYLSQPGVARVLLGGWQLSGVATARSGLPINVTVDRSNAAVPTQDSISGSERPDIVPGVSATPQHQTPGNWINLAAFAVPANGTFGDAGRNLLRGPGLWQIDSALTRRVSLTERLSLQIRAEAYNLFNRAQYGNPNADISSALNFGLITSTVNAGATGSGTPRQFQFAIRLAF